MARVPALVGAKRGFTSGGNHEYLGKKVLAHCSSCRNPVFLPGRDYQAGPWVRSVATGDLNEDGHQEVVTASGVVFGVGDGTFAPGTRVEVGACPIKLALGDFDLDGNQDLATANNAGSVSSLLNQGPFSGCLDADGDGFGFPGNPGAAEICDTLDNDCDGSVDLIVQAACAAAPSTLNFSSNGEGFSQEIIAIMQDVPDGEDADLCITSTYPADPAVLKIGRDQKLARQLWESNVYDAKVLGLLMDEPKKMTREQAEEQVENLNMGMLSHVFASCNATLAKAPFTRELAVNWAEAEDDMRRRCAYLLLYELSKNTRDKELTDAFFTGYITRMRESIHDEENWVRAAMTGALMGIGKRNVKLNRAAIKAVKAIGPVEVDYGEDNSCESLNIMKHLTSEYVTKKLKA